MASPPLEPPPQFKPPNQLVRVGMVLGVIAVVALLNRTPPPPPPPPPVKLPFPAREIAASTWLNTNGKPLKLADLKGKVVLLEFWRSKCTHCEEAWPWVKELARKFAADLKLITIHAAVEEGEYDLDTLRDFVREKGIDAPVAVDNERANLNAYRFEQMTPTFALINRKGNVVSYQPSKNARELLTQQIQMLLQGDDLELAAKEGKTAAPPEAPEGGLPPTATPDGKVNASPATPAG